MLLCLWIGMKSPYPHSTAYFIHNKSEPLTALTADGGCILPFCCHNMFSFLSVCSTSIVHLILTANDHLLNRIHAVSLVASVGNVHFPWQLQLIFSLCGVKHMVCICNNRNPCWITCDSCKFASQYNKPL